MNAEEEIKQKEDVNDVAEEAILDEKKDGEDCDETEGGDDAEGEVEDDDETEIDEDVEIDNVNDFDSDSDDDDQIRIKEIKCGKIAMLSLTIVALYTVALISSIVTSEACRSAS